MKIDKLIENLERIAIEQEQVIKQKTDAIINQHFEKLDTLFANAQIAIENETNRVIQDYVIKLNIKLADKVNCLDLQKLINDDYEDKMFILLASMKEYREAIAEDKMRLEIERNAINSSLKK